MRALQMDPINGSPQRWAQNCFYMCAYALLATAVWFSLASAPISAAERLNEKRPRFSLVYAGAVAGSQPLERASEPTRCSAHLPQICEADTEYLVASAVTVASEKGQPFITSKASSDKHIKRITSEMCM